MWPPMDQLIPRDGAQPSPAPQPSLSQPSPPQSSQPQPSLPQQPAVSVEQAQAAPAVEQMSALKFGLLAFAISSVVACFIVYLAGLIAGRWRKRAPAVYVDDVEPHLRMRLPDNDEVAAPRYADQHRTYQADPDAEEALRFAREQRRRAA